MANGGRPLHRDVWAIVPIKESIRQATPCEGLIACPATRTCSRHVQDVMQALSASQGLAGIAVVTLDQNATQIAARWEAEVWTDGGREGHTGAVMAAARRLAATGSTMLTIPGDVPGVSPGDIAAILAAHPHSPRSR
jgi:2-phospho-L-lactate guanylyltransferase